MAAGQNDGHLGETRYGCFGIKDEDSEFRVLIDLALPPIELDSAVSAIKSLLPDHREKQSQLTELVSSAAPNNGF